MLPAELLQLHTHMGAKHTSPCLPQECLPSSSLKETHGHLNPVTDAHSCERPFPQPTHYPFLWPFSTLGFFLNYFFWLHHIACVILDPQPEMEPVPPALEAWSLKYWTAREVPTVGF